jgi:hypothetical protein
MIRLKRSFFILLPLILGSVSFAFAQKDYVVTLKQDTIWGEAKNYGADWLKFLPADSAKKQRYKPGQIKSFYHDERHVEYHSIKLITEKKEFFLQKLESGKITLFQLVQVVPGPHSVMATRWYATKGDQTLAEIKTNTMVGSRKERKNAFTALIEDDAELLQQYVASGEFGFEFLRTMIKQYNKRALPQSK